MKKIVQLCIALMLCHFGDAQKITLVEAGKSAYTIVIPANASLVEIQSGKVLQDYLYRITGVTLPVGFDSAAEKSKEILIGNVNRPQLKKIDYDKFGKDGLLIRTDNNKLIITGLFTAYIHF